MTPGSESSVGLSNVQDAFFNHVQRERLTVAIHMMDGTEMEGRIKNVDRFSVVLEHAGADYLIFKHAIAAIRTPKTIPNYASSQ